MNVNSSTYSSASTAKSSSSHGLSGLMSGMDTESMVDKMLSGTQGKIDKQEALKQQTLWKQEIYRDIITNVNSFYSKYFDTSYGSSLKNNFASDSFFNAMVSNIRSGDALRVISTNSSALSGDMKIAVKQLAANAAMKSEANHSISSGTITGKAVTSADLVKSLEKKVTLKVGGTDVEVNLNNATTESGVLDAFNTALKGKGVTASVVDGRMRLVADNPSTTVAVDKEKSSSLGLSVSGLGSVFTHTEGKDPVSGNSVGIYKAGTLQPKAGSTITLTLDGVSKDISLNDVAGADGKITAKSVLEAVQKQVGLAFGSYIKVENAIDTTVAGNEDKLQLKFGITNGSKGHELRITGMDSTKLGISAGSSTLISTASTLGDLKGQLKLEGDRFNFKINGVDFSFTSNQSLGTVINTINNSKAGVKLSYSSLSDSFSMESTSSGKNFGIDLEQKEGNLLSVMFGSSVVAAGGAVGSSQLTTGTVANETEGLESGYTAMGGSMTMNVNGKNHTFTLSPKTNILGMPTGEAYTKSEIETQLNSWLKENFSDKKDASGNPIQGITYDSATGELKTEAGYAVSFAKSKIDLQDEEAVKEAKKTDFGLAFGFTINGANNIATADTDISEIKELSGFGNSLLKADGTAATKLSDIAQVQTTDQAGNPITMDASFADGRMSIKGNGTVEFAAGSTMETLFGSQVTFGDGKVGANAVTAGKDAEVYINGVLTSRSSNNFTIDGVTMELTKVSAADTGTTSGLAETVISTSRDEDSIVEGFKTFVEDYNKMLEKVNGYLNQDADYRDYAPLTSAQKKEMSENEITEWEKKAKTGLVRHDNTVSALMSSIRNILYTKPEGSAYALYNIGIETVEYTAKTSGQLSFDESALRDALAADPDAVRQLFTDSTAGISKQLMGAMDAVVKTKGANPGSLVQMAGMPGTTSEKGNSMYDQLTRINDRIKDLKAKYEKERARYWNQFNSMEQILSNYNSQSSYLAQQFGGY